MAQATARSLSRLSRDKILDLCSEWAHSTKCDPYLTTNRNAVESEEEDYLHEPAKSRKDLHDFYNDLKHNGSSGGSLSLNRKGLIDRILDGDWRRGLSLHQHATIDFAYLEQNEKALRWTALKLVPLKYEAHDREASTHPSKRRKLTKTTTQAVVPHYPSIDISAFLHTLDEHISPLVKAHTVVHRLPSPHNVNIVRIFVMPSAPFAPTSANIPRNAKSAVDPSRSIYIAVPDSCPYVWISVSGGVASRSSKKPEKGKPIAGTAKLDLTATKRIVLEAIPKAFSNPYQRWSLEGTKLTAKSLRALSLLRGNQRQGSGGAWADLSEVNQSPLNDESSDATPASDSQAPILSSQQRQAKPSDREKLVRQRFGAGQSAAHAPIDRLHLRIRDCLSDPARSKARKRRADGVQAQQDNPVTMTFTGADVFAGLKRLAQMYPQYVDLEHLPVDLTGAKNMSNVVI